MNSRKAEYWLSLAMDGELSPRRQAKLNAYLTLHPELEQLRRDWEEAGQRLRQIPVVTPQTPAAAWQDVQRAIRMETPAVSAAPIHRWGWAGAVLAGILVLAGAGLLLIGSPSGQVLGPIALADRTQVEWIETDVPDAMSMVFEDASTGLTVIWVMMNEPVEEDEHAG